MTSLTVATAGVASETCQHIEITGKGGTEVLALVRTPLPEPGPGEVRVRVLAAGVGYSDVMAQHGGYPLAPAVPFTPGYDLAGVVDKVGAGVKDLSPGQTVAALNPAFGCYAEYARVPASLLVPFPDSCDPAEVVSLVLNYLTAHCILHKKANMQPGETVLVHSAAGGVGTALLELGRLLDLTLYGTASAGKHELVERLGGIPIDYRSRDFVDEIRSRHPGGVDAAFDPIGGAHLQRSYQAVRSGGRVVCYGFASRNFGGYWPMISGVLQMAYLNLLPNGKRVRLCATPGEVKKHNAWYRQTLASLIDLLATDRIRPVVGARVELSNARHAHSLIEQGLVTGKVVLVNTPA